MNSIQGGSDTDVDKLCEEVIKVSSKPDISENNIGQSLSVLRRICGRNFDSCSTYTPYQSLRLLLQLQSIETVVDYSVGVAVINNYSTLNQNNCNRVLEQLLRYSLSTSISEERDIFLDQIWNYPGLKNFSVDVIEEFLVSNSSKLEEELFNVFIRVLQNITASELAWEDQSLERFALWSSKSAKTFTTVSCVLNSCMLRVVTVTNQYETCVDVVKQFINKVKAECASNKQDFVLLYPYEYHSLVSLLDIPPECYPKSAEHGSTSIDTVVRIIKQNLACKTAQTICLLTHFSEWAPYLGQ